MSETVVNSSNSSTQKINKLIFQVGKNPVDPFAKYDAPNLWMAISNLASLLEASPTSESEVKASIDVSKQQLKSELKADMTATLAADLKPLNEGIVSGQNYFMLGMTALKDQINDEGNRVDGLVNNINTTLSSSDNNTPNINTTASHPDISRLEGLILDISNRLNQVDSLNYSDSIKFCGLNLRSKKEVIAWLALNSPGERGSLVIYFHTYMAHVHNNTTGQDVIQRHNSLYKLKIETISQGAAITLFECTIPRFFSISTSHRAPKDSASYFDIISEFDLWDQADDEYKEN